MALRALPDQAPEPVPVGVDRQRLGGPGELGDEAFPGMVVEIHGMMDQRVDQARVTLSASAGSTWRRLSRSGVIRRKMSVQFGLADQLPQLLELGRIRSPKTSPSRASKLEPPPGPAIACWSRPLRRSAIAEGARSRSRRSQLASASSRSCR